MDDRPDGRDVLRSELDQLRAEVRDLRDDLDHHLVTCPGSLAAASDG